MAYRNGFSPARPLWEARLGRTDADPGVRTLERGAGAEAARPAEASGVSSLGKAPRGGARGRRPPPTPRGPAEPRPAWARLALAAIAQPRTPRHLPGGGLPP